MMKDNMTELDVLCVGTALIDSMICGFDPQPVSAAGFRARSSELFPGGEAVNVSVAAAKLGLKSGIFCRLGQDTAGDMVVRELENHGVDVGRILRSADVPTPVTTMFVDEKGDRRSITNLAHAHNFHPEAHPERMKGARAVVLGSLFRAPFNDVEVLKKTVDILREERGLLFADTKLPNFSPLSLEDVAIVLPYLDCITPNEAEAAAFTGKETPEEMGEVFLHYGARRVVIKLGERGCYYCDHETNFFVPGFSVATVDATGAGDNFMAGLLSEVLGGASIKEALLFANACGAICATAVGAGVGLKSREQVEALLQAQKPQDA